MSTDSIPRKTCSKCGETKSIEEFYPRKDVKAGRYAQCKACRAESSRLAYAENPEKFAERGRRYRAENPEKIAERMRRYHAENSEKFAEHQRRYRAENPEKAREVQRRYYVGNSEKIAERGRRYRAENVEKTAERTRRWRAENPERELENKRRYRAENPDVGRAENQRRRARKRGLPNTFTVADWRYCLDYFNGCCAVCGRQLKDLLGTHTAAADHWIPLSNSDCPGTIPTNIVCLCHGIGGCNNSKHDKPPLDWLTRVYGTKKANQILARIQVYFDSLRDETE